MSAISTVLGSLIMPVKTWSPAKESPHATFVYVDLSSIDRETKEIVAPQQVTGANAPSRAKQLLKAGDVLVSTVRPNLNAVGVVPDGLDGATGSTGFCVLRADPQRLDNRYLYHWVRSPAFIASMVRRATGASYPAVSDRVVKQSKISLPPLPEQRRIAAILDKADAIRRKRQQTLALADQFLRSAFLDMFGDPVTNPKGWPVKKLGDLLVFLTSGSRGWAKYYSREGAAFLRIQNIGRNRLLLDNLAHVFTPDTTEAIRTRVQPGDVVLSITADLGRAAVIPTSLGPAHVNQHLGLLRTENINPIYLAEFLVSDSALLQFRLLDTGQTRSGLNFADLKRLKVPCPPQELQKKFAVLHSRIEALRPQLIVLLTEGDNLINSLVRHANVCMVCEGEAS